MATIIFYLDDASTLTQPLDGSGVVTIGRHPDSVVQLTNGSVSSHHATLIESGGSFYVQDLKSSNGTRVNGADIEEAILHDGDRIAFGDVASVFYAGDPPPEPPAPDVPLPAPAIAPSAPEKKAGNYLPPPPVRRAPPRKASGYPDTSGSGCMTAGLVITLFLIAFIGGLSLRHYKETDGGNLVNDLIEKLTNGMPKFKIEKKVE